MISKVSLILGTMIVITGVFWLRGPAVLLHEYLYALATMLLGVLVIWLGNRDLFKRDNVDK
jgi:hypothetical protein